MLRSKPPPCPFKICLCFVTGTKGKEKPTQVRLWEAGNETSRCSSVPVGMGLCLARAWEGWEGWDGCLSHLQVHSCSQVSAGDLNEPTECDFSSFSWILLFCGVEEQSSLHVLLTGAAGRHCPAVGKSFFAGMIFFQPEVPREG